MNNGKQIAYKYLLSKRPSGVYEITTELQSFPWDFFMSNALVSCISSVLRLRKKETISTPQ